jgi:two-component system, cell cycle sensor histidine kinase and response regulator CckA
MERGAIRQSSAFAPVFRDMTHSPILVPELVVALRERFTRRLAGTRAAESRMPQPAESGVSDGQSQSARNSHGAATPSAGFDVDSLTEQLLSDLLDVVGAGDGIGKGTNGTTGLGESLLRELQSTETRYRSLLEIAPDAIAILQNDRIVFANTAALRLVGATSADEIVGRSLNEHIHPDDLAHSLDRRRELTSGRTAVPASEIRLRTLDGRYILVETRAGVCEFHGAPAIQIVARDITDRKRDDGYREAQNRVLERIALGAPLPEILHDLVLKVEGLIPGRWCAFYLWDPRTRAIRIGAAPSMPPEYNAAMDGLVLDAETGSCGPAIHHGRTWITEDIQCDPFWTEYREIASSFGFRAVWSTPIVTREALPPTQATLGTFAVYSSTPHVPTESEQAIVGRAVHLARIALENDRARQELRASEARYRAFVDQSSDSLFLFGEDNLIVDVNSRACEKLGFSRQELLGASAALFDPLVANGSLGKFPVEARRKDFHTFETRHRRKSGEEFPVEVRLRWFEMNGSQHVVASAHDITQRLVGERTLRESEARYRQLAEAMPQMVWIATPGEGVEYINERARSALGDIAACDLVSILHPDDVALIEKRWRDSVATGTAMEVEHRLRDAETGEFRWFLTRWAPLDSATAGTNSRRIGTSTDIHALKEAQNAVLAERDRLTRMAAIAPGVIHTIRVRPDGTRAFEFVGESIADVLGVSAAEALASHASMNRYVHPDDLQRIQASAAKSARALTPWHCEYRVLHPDRGELWVEARSIPVAEPGGDVLWHGFLTDITRRKTAEAALLEEHERLVETQARAHLGYFEWDVATDAVLWSAELYRIFDLDPASFRPTGTSFLERVHPDDRDHVQFSIGQALSGSPGFSHEERIVRPCGAVRYLESSGRAEFDASGNPVRMTGACLDITDRKLAELKLKDSERRLRSLADGIPQIVWGADAAGDLNLFNARTSEYTGLATSQLLGWGWGAVIHPDDLSNTVTNWTEILRTGEPQPLEFRIRRHDGAYRWFLTRQVPVRDDRGVIQSWYGSCTDVHDAREAALAVQASQERLSAMIRNAPGVAIQFYDRAGRVLQWNAASEKVFGFTSAEALGHTLDRLIHTPEEFRNFLVYLDEIERTGEPVGPSEYKFRRKSGEEGHSLSTLFSIPGEDGQTWFVCVDVDITERKVAEEKLRASESLMRAIIDNAQCAIWVKDLGGRYRVVNRFFNEVFNVSADDLLGKTVDEIAPPEIAQYSNASDIEVRDTKRSLDYEETFTIGGQERTFLVTKFPILDPADRVSDVAGVAIDITDHVRLEEQLRQSQKMEAIGQLAGGVAHDFNNMLLVINGYAEMLLETTEPEHPQQAALAGIREAGRRAAELTNQLLAFSRKSPIRPRRLEVNQVVAASESLLKRLIGEQIRLTLIADPEVGPIRADRGHLEQVLLNLVVNARDAMPGGGEIQIQTAAVTLPSTADERIAPRGFDDRFVCISVSDTGCGMPDEVAARVFEPFFTTKGVGRGTGLGLSVVHGAVTQNGGCIRVQSEVGVGTTFEIYFPELLEEEPETPAN